MMILPACAEDDTTQVFAKCSCLKSLPYEPVGRWFEACLKRQRSEKSVSIIEEVVDEQNSSDEDDAKELSGEDKAFLMSLDVSEWKKQDHYRILGLENLRYDATDDDIRKAYRKKVLRHHPDKKSKHKKAILPAEVNEHEYFTCITRAYETLSSLKKRQAFDSVDPKFSDFIPTNCSGDDFFEVFGKVVENNARWSSHQPVPLLGDMDTSMENVHEFYTFWYDFRSWRNFSNLDQEDTDKAENREERRWMDHENRKMRQKRKKEEISRIRRLVDTLSQNDPRLKKFRKEKKMKKQEEQQAREIAQKEKEKQRQLLLEEDKKIKDKAEQDAKEKAQKEKKEREKVRKIAARDRKIIRQAVKNANFFDLGEDKVKRLERLEKSLENLSLQNLQTLREASETPDTDHFKDIYVKQSTEILERLQAEYEENVRCEEAAMANSLKQAAVSSSSADNTWSDMEKQLLVKATTLFPVGTASRWEVIAAYINEHSGSERKKNAKHVINKVKNLKKLDPSHKAEVNKMAFQTLEKTTSAKLTSPISADPSKAVVEEALWSSDEQKLLEQALKSFPSNTPERWDKIANLIPTRTKKECMKRYKELVEMVKAKKAAETKTS